MADWSFIRATFLELFYLISIETYTMDPDDGAHVPPRHCIFDDRGATCGVPPSECLRRSSRRAVVPLSAVMVAGFLLLGAARQIYRFPLSATASAPGAEGQGMLALGWSPFGVALGADGRTVYDLDVRTSGLRAPSRLGPYSEYTVWMTTPTLDTIVRLGPLDAAGRFHGRANLTKFLLVVSAERSDSSTRMHGPIVLRGRSPSTLVQAFQSHQLYNLFPD